MELLAAQPQFGGGEVVVGTPVAGRRRARFVGTPGTPAPAPVGTPVAPAAPVRGRGRREGRLFGSPEEGVEASAVSRALGTPRRVAVAEERPGAMEVLRVLRSAVAALGQYKCGLAIRYVAQLPRAHRDTGYVHALVGRAHLEGGEFGAAEGAFVCAMRADPGRLDGVVEYYSTALWQLKKETKLAEVAIRAFHQDRSAAATWVAVGNCYSLQRDPDGALRYFLRAARVDPYNAYAHTLAGHEYVAKEQFDAALAAYRAALKADERCYNALYGIAQVLLRQEKFALAERHFRAALRVHPRNAHLHYHLGIALAAAAGAGGKGRAALLPALSELEAAAALDPRNPIPRFERAKVLMAMDRLSDARGALEALRDTLPKEAAVFHELGKVCRRMGDRREALRCFSTALDVDPKDQGRRYKKAIDSLYADEDEDED